MLNLKYSRSKSFTRSLLRNLAAIISVMAALVIVASCSDELTSSLLSSSEEIRFKVSIDNGSSWQSRSDGEENTEPKSKYVGCIPLDATTEDGDSIYLHITVRQGIESAADTAQADSRSKVINNMTDYESFYVHAATFKGEWDDETCYPDYMYNSEFKYQSATGTWAEDNPHFWRCGYNTRIFAYSAPNDTRNCVSISSQTEKGVPKISYYANTAISAPDLIVASSDVIDSEPATMPELNFKHIMTAVKVKAAADFPAGTVTATWFCNLYKSADYYMDGIKGWSNYAALDSTGVSSRQPQTDGISETEILSGDNYTLFLIPQNLPENAYIRITFKEKWSGESVRLTADIGGTTWEPGTTVEYTVSTSAVLIEPYLDIIPSFGSENCFYTNITNKFNVYSCFGVSVKGGDVSYFSEPWEYEFVEDDGAGGYKAIAKPSWIPTLTLTKTNVRGQKGTGGGTLTVQISPYERETDTHTPALQSAAAKTDCDLSLDESGVRTTANCYVVNAPGTYRLPLVYGNAIKNGAVYPDSYSNAENYLGNAITSPYISTDTGTAPVNATIVWQDEPNLVQNVSIDGDYLTFSVPASTIHQGNAVIAVRDADNVIMWSWHIWVTDFDPYGPDGYFLPSATSTYKIMSRYLGWCDLPDIIYIPRSVKIRLYQPDTGAEKIVEFTVKDTSSSCNFPLYQWGRKDPGLIVYNGMDYDTKYKDVYAESYYAPARSSISAKINYYTTITQPYTFNLNSVTGISYYNLDNKLLWSESIKTVYDPSPRGYRIPSIAALSVIEKGTLSPFLFQGISTPVYSSGGDCYDFFFPLVKSITDNNGIERGTSKQEIRIYSGLGGTSTNTGVTYFVGEQLHLRITSTGVAQSFSDAAGPSIFSMSAVMPIVDE